MSKIWGGARDNCHRDCSTSDSPAHQVRQGRCRPSIYWTGRRRLWLCLLLGARNARCRPLEEDGQVSAGRAASPPNRRAAAAPRRGKGGRCAVKTSLRDCFSGPRLLRWVSAFPAKSGACPRERDHLHSPTTTRATARTMPSGRSWPAWVGDYDPSGHGEGHRQRHGDGRDPTKIGRVRLV